MTKACFYRFLLHQTQSKYNGNVRKKSVIYIIYRKSGIGRVGASADSGGGAWLAASYTRMKEYCFMFVFNERLCQISL